jgi:RHS repeat-associated protein
MMITFTAMTTAGRNNGLYYYGARYYNPMVSVWLGACPERLCRFGMDPLAHKYPSMSSYVFTGNNPVYLIDFDGRSFTKYNDPPKKNANLTGPSTPTPPAIIPVPSQTATSRTNTYASHETIQTVTETAGRIGHTTGDIPSQPQIIQPGSDVPQIRDDSESSSRLTGGFVLQTNTNGDLIGQNQETRKGNGDNETRNIDGMVPVLPRGTSSSLDAFRKVLDGLKLVGKGSAAYDETKSKWYRTSEIRDTFRLVPLVNHETGETINPRVDSIPYKFFKVEYPNLNTP